MKFEFIEARLNKNTLENLRNLIKYNEKEFEKIEEKTIFIGTSVQFLDLLEDFKNILEKKNKSVIILKGTHSFYEGQILGCDLPFDKINLEKTNKSALLLISSGTFHAFASQIKNISMKTYFLDPFTMKIKTVKRTNIKGLILKFLDAKNIGVLISTKPGQYNESKIKELESMFQKNYFKIIQDNINPFLLTDFNYIDFFVNTACPRLFDNRKDFEKPILNIEQILEFFKNN